MIYRGDPLVYQCLDKLSIPYSYYEHPPAPTVEIAALYWKDIDAAHCKNLFFRNHKGNRHYLVIFHYQRDLNVKELEMRLRQGKLSFASEQRMLTYLGLKPGSVSPFGLIHDHGKHVHLFIDSRLREHSRISFHPNDNTASLVIATADFVRFLDARGNSYDFLELYA
jgi:Ala-tRNA(Pro) deacylase